jgi:hypothetical protein
LADFFADFFFAAAFFFIFLAMTCAPQVTVARAEAAMRENSRRQIRRVAES